MQPVEKVSETRNDLVEYKEHGLWDAWCENAYESGPHVVFQMVLLMERTKTKPLVTFASFTQLDRFLMWNDIL